MPKDSEQKDTVPCVICGRETTLEDASAAMHDAAGQQRFAHAEHIRGRTEYIVGLAHFVAKERMKLLNDGIEPSFTEERNATGAWAFD